MKIGHHLSIKTKFLFAFLILLLLAFVSLVYVPTKLELFNLSGEKKEIFLHILKKIRLPSVLISVVSGAALALSGFLMQTVLANDLASPFTFGSSSAAAFGASLAITLSYHLGLNASPNLFAFIFSIISMCIVLVIAGFTEFSKKTLILIGMTNTFFFSSSMNLLRYFSSQEVSTQILSWSNGSVNNATIKDIVILSVLFLLSLIATLILSNDLSSIMQGEKKAKSLGIEVGITRIIVLVFCSILTSFTVSIIGIIGFVGLVAPHLSKLICTEKLKYSVLLSVMIGSSLLIIADMLSKMLLYPVVLPIGSVTSFLGIPFILIMLYIKRR